jgi:hypothetical protein
MNAARAAALPLVAFVLLALSCAPHDAGKAPSSEPQASGTTDDAAIHQALDARRRAHANACAETCCLHDGPPSEMSASTLMATRALLSSTDADARALALSWIGAAGGVEDVARVRALLSDASIVDVARVHASQRMQPCYPVAWEKVKVGDLAQDAEGTLLRRSDVQAQLKSLDPAAWARMMMSSDTASPNEDELVEIARARLGRDALFALVENRAEQREKGTNARAYAFVCEHAERLFSPARGDEAARMQALLASERAIEGADRTWEILATVCAASFVRGAGLAAMLSTEYDRTRGALIAKEMGRRAFPELSARLRTIFLDPTTSFVVREEIAAGIATRGPSAKRDLAQTVTGAPRDALREIARALVDAVGHVDPKFPAQEIGARLIPPLKKSATEEERAAEAKHAADAADAALDRALAALAAP